MPALPPLSLAGPAAAAALLLACAGVAHAATTTVDLYRNNPALDNLGGEARPAKNVAYYGEFALGTPPQRLTACFDTGSSDSWIPGSLCLAPPCATHDKFRPMDSSTYHLRPEPFHLAYGTGRVVGSVATETLTIGSPPMAVPNQGFGMVVDTSADFGRTSCDGLVGLGFSSLSVMKQPTLFDSMRAAGLLDAPRFSVWLSDDPDQEPAGAITFGGVDPERYSGKIHFLPVVTRKFWSVALDGITTSAPGAPRANVSATTAILDTGTTALIMSHEDAAAVHAGIPGVKLTKGGYYNITAGCGAVDTLPDLVFILGGRRFALPPRLWVQQIPATGGEDPALMCVSAIIPGPTNKERGVVLGDAFLRAWYSVYEVEGPPGAETGARVGLARSAAVPTPPGKEVQRAEPPPEGKAGGGGPRVGLIGKRLL